MEAIKDIIANFPSDVQRGWNDATPAALATGKMTALAVSVPLILVLIFLTPLDVFAAIIIGAAVQLLLGWAIAGREMRKGKG